MTKATLALSRATRRYQEILQATFRDLEGRVRIEDAWRAVNRTKMPDRLAKARLCIAMNSIGFTTKVVVYVQPADRCYFVRGDKSRQLAVAILPGFGSTAFVSPVQDSEL